jgi:2-polyprenyl-3-methyl-5-hydroxy-6-metoxy-1,4-benzoquinol methylase
VGEGCVAKRVVAIRRHGQMSRTVRCNLCGGTDYGYYKNPSNDGRIVRCNKCGLVFTNPQPDEKELKKTLNNESSPSQEILDIEKEKFKIYLDEIEALSGAKKGKLLDVGCGFGYLLAIAKERGWDTCGVEFNRKRVDFILEKYGIEVFCGELENAGFQTDSFDVVTIVEVLEHIPDPNLFLREISRIIKKDGIVAIVTPNVESFYAKTDPNWWTPYHFYHFSSKTLEAILAKNGIRIVRVVINPHFETRKNENRFFKVRKNLFANFRWGIVLIRRILTLGVVARFIWKCGAIKTGGITVYGKKAV